MKKRQPQKHTRRNKKHPMKRRHCKNEKARMTPDKKDTFLDDKTARASRTFFLQRQTHSAERTRLT
jgi:hypothetical protein